MPAGETEQEPSGWTVDTLAVYLQTQLDDLKITLDERYGTQTKAVEAAFSAQQTAMQTAFAAADKAIDQRADTLDREFHEHLEQVRHENALAFINSDKAVQAALASAKEAVSKAEAATDKRFESVNEFRAQLNDQARLFLPRSEYDANHKALEQRVAEVNDRLNRSEGKGAGYQSSWGIIIALVTVVISVVVVVNLLVTR